MFWTALGVIGTAGLITLFAVSTDGRYFGKRLSYIMYNQLGPLLFVSSRDDRKWARLMEVLGPMDGGSILDVGTALGRLPAALASTPGFHGRIVGVDWSPRMVNAARRRTRKLGLSPDRVAFEVVDVRGGLPFQEGEFDVVFCLGLLETLKRPEDTLRELRRVVKDEGLLVLSFYRGRTSWGYSLPYEWYLRNLSAQGLANVEKIRFRNRYDFIVARTPPLVRALSYARSPPPSAS